MTDQLRELNVVGIKESYTGTSTKTGDEYTLYELEVQDADGKPIVEKCKSFQRFEPGLKKYLVKPYNKHGELTSYTLSLPGAGGSGFGGSWLVGRVKEIEDRVNALERRILNDEDMRQTAHDFPTPSATPPTADDQIPF